MKVGSGIKKNFVFQVVYQIMSMALPFITSPYIARTIGAEGIGAYSYSSTIANYFVIFSMLGLSNYGNREIAMSRDNKKKLDHIFSSLIYAHMFVSVPVVCLYVIYATHFASSKIYAIVQLIYVLSGLCNISWFYFGLEKFRLTVGLSMVLKVINLFSIFLLVKRPEDLILYCVIMAGGILTEQILLWIPIKRYTNFVMVSKKEIIAHMKPMVILFIPVIAVSVYKYMDKIMIGYFCDRIQLGFYENGEKLVNMPMAIIVSFGTVMMPMMSNLAAKNSLRDSQIYISYSFRYIMCLAFGLAFGLSAISNVFAPLFWGDEFRPCGNIIMILSLTIPFTSFANILRTQYLIPQKMDRQYLSSVVTGAIVNFCINYLLIPSCGSIGASIGTVFAEFTVFFVQSVMLNRMLPIKDYICQCIPYLVIGVIMYSVVLGIGNIIPSIGWSGLVLQIMIGIGIYGTLSIMYLILIKDNMVTSIYKKIIGYISIVIN